VTLQCEHNYFKKHQSVHLHTADLSVLVISSRHIYCLSRYYLSHSVTKYRFLCTIYNVCNIQTHIFQGSFTKTNNRHAEIISVLLSLFMVQYFRTHYWTEFLKFYMRLSHSKLTGNFDFNSYYLTT
jgi:hypothetical protein